MNTLLERKVSKVVQDPIGLGQSVNYILIHLFHKSLLIIYHMYERVRKGWGR